MLVASMLFSMMPGWANGAAADASSAPARSAEESHWGIETMKAWVEKGLMAGYPDGSLRPDEPVTRAQFAHLINSVFRYPASADPGFTDVPETAWYYADVAAAAGAGIINGYPDGQYKPGAYVRKQDAAKMVAGAFKLMASDEELSESPLSGYKDADEVHDYAENALAKLTADGSMNGYPDGTLRPLQSITRAEAVAMLSELAGEVIQAPGTYKDIKLDGNLVVNTAGVKLENAIVKGNMYLTSGVGDGDVEITDSEVLGALHINGGGSESVHILKSRIGTLIVNRLEGTVRVVLGEQSEVTEMAVENKSVIELEEGAFVKLLSFLESAKGSTLQSKGSIEEILNEAGVEVPEVSPSPTPSAPSGPVITPVPTSNPSPAPTDLPDADDWKLVWNDEFDRSGDNLDPNGVDKDKWGYQLGTGAQYGLDGWGNNEQQYYRSENIAVENGMLTITARKEAYEGKPYTSGRLFTEPTFSQTYGKFEARMKLPEGEGLWPAFWMMPKDSAYGAWAASGELDIMEARGRLPGEVGGTIHFGRNWPNNKSTGDEYHFEEGEDITDFHVYGVEWEPGEIRWYVDGELYQTINNWDSWGAGQPAKYAYPAPFDKPFYMILNLAVGGNYDGGRLPNDSDLPAEMLVDYVRVYELDGQPYRTPVEPVIDAEPYPADYKEPMDGSFVYDPSFQQPVTDITTAGALNEDYWNFVRVPDFGGAGDDSIDIIDGTRYLKADITNGGNAAHAVQLIQNVTLGKGRWYKLGFDAKSNANRAMTVKLGGGENRGWSVYSDSLQANLSSELQSYEMTFQMASETDTLARLEFNMGLSTQPVWIGNVRLEETTAPDPYAENAEKEPLEDGNHVYNGSFDLGYMHRMTYWQLQNEGSALSQGAVDQDDRELKVAISSPGSSASDIALVQKGLTLVDGNEYRLTFKARASGERTIAAELRKQDGSVYAEAVSAAIGTEMAEYTMTFWIEGGEGAASELAFLLGGANGDVYVDDVRLVRTTDNNIGELPLSDQFPLKNGGFSNGKTGWSEHVQGRYDGWDQTTSFSVQDEEMVGHISSVGNNPWDVMLMQTDFALKKGQTYVISLDAKASLNRETEIVLDINNGGTRVLSKREALTENWKTFSYELEVTADATASFKMLLGKLADAASITVPHQVWVDNVKVEVKDARKDAFLAVNGYFDDGMTDWLTHVQGVYDGPSRAVFAEENGGLRASVQHPGVNPWDIVLSQPAVDLKKGQTYIVSFVARAATPRSMDLSAENTAYFRYLDKRLKVEDFTQAYSFEFTMPKDDSVSLKLLFGKLPDDTAAANDIFIDNVRFELKGAQEATGEKPRAGHNIGLTAPPVVSPDASNNVVGEEVVLTFAPNAAWAAGINKIFVNDIILTADQFEATSAQLSIDGEVFGEAGTYTITIRAAGFEPAAVTQEIVTESMWTLVWNDEFDGTGDTLDTNGVDLEKWAYQEGTGVEYGVANWGNNELQYYSKNNISVENGKLVIEAKNESKGGKAYTSGRLWTSPTFAKKYGKFEARMKLPAGTGLWPAFWLMPKDSEYGGWASSGEIDIMEARGRLPHEVDGTIHYGKNSPNNKLTGSSYEFPEGQDFTDYHTYSVEWEPGELRWYVDGKLYQTINDWHSWGAGQPDKYAFPAPFDKEFYIIMNLAVGGNYDGGRTPDPGVIPAAMEVDYVRVYELTGREYKEPVEPVLVKDEFPQDGKPPVNGSLIYDADYAEGITDVTAAAPDMDMTYWNFLHDNEFGGKGSASVETIDGDSFAKFSLTEGGNAVHALQLIQYLTLTKGHYYKLSFDAKAEASRSMSVKFGGDASSNWSIYSDNFNVALKESLESYEFRFQMTGSTNPLARLEFNMGQNISDVWIGNVKVEEIDMLSSPDDPKSPLDNGNHVYNGAFDLGTMDRMKYWHVDSAEGAAVTAAVDPDERWLTADVTSGGSGIGDITLTQKGVQLLQSDTYQLSFDAWSEAGRSLAVRLTSKDGGTVYAGPFSEELGSTKERYTHTFTMPEGVTDTESQLQVLLGGETGDVQLDNVVLNRTSNRNVDYTGVDLYPVKNGDFYFGLNGWEPFTQVGAAAFDTEDGAAKIHVTNVGTEGWNVMLNRPNLQLTGGLSYELAFDVRSSVARDIEVSIENGAYDRRFFSGSLAVTPETKRYTFVFRMPIDESTALKFMMGKTPNSVSAAHDIFVDNVTLSVQYAPALRPATVIPDEDGNFAGANAELAYSPNEAWASAISGILVNKMELAADDYTVSDGHITIDGAAFPQEGIYTIVIKADAYADVTVRQEMLAADGNLVLNGDMAQGLASWETWEGEGGDSTVTAENGAAKAVIHWHGGVHPQWNVPISWSTQLIQSGVELKAGKMYELSFNAWSTADRPIVVELGGYNGAAQVLFNLSSNGGAAHKTVLRPGSDIALALKFLLGNVVNGDLKTPDAEHAIFIDNVAIREVASPPALTADASENKVGQSITVTFPDSEAWRSSVQTIRVDGTPVSSDLYTLEAGQLTFAASVFPSKGYYTIAIEAAGYGLNEVTQEVKTAAANIALNRSADASTGKASAVLAFDGNTGTRWESEFADPQWLTVDLGGLYDLEEAVLRWEGAFAKNYKLQVSTASTPGESDWVDVHTDTNGNGGIDTIALNGADARHIRIWGAERGTPYGYSLWEVEVYGTLIEADGSDGSDGSGE